MGTKNDFFCFLSLAEGTEIVVNLIDIDVWEGKYEHRGAFSDEVEN